MKNLISFIFLVLVTCHQSEAQPPHTFTQYTSENGLSQKTMQCILQDKKGLMWFATWDGLYKFDGYTFKSYKAYPGDDIKLSNNRINYVQEDSYGYIWIESYDHQIYRFDPRQELFEAIPYENYSSQNIYIHPTGDVWITTSHKELIHISTDSVTHGMTAINFFDHHQIPFPDRVNKIYQDKANNQWILSDRGLYKISKTLQGDQLSSYFATSFAEDKNTFYDIAETRQGIYFSSAKGKVYLYTDGQFESEKLPTPSSVKFVRLLTADKLFLGTASDGFFVYDTKTKTNRHYNKELKNSHIKDVYIDKRKEVWLRLNMPGVTHFDPKAEQISYFILYDKHGREITESRMEMEIREDVNGSLWIHPPGGGFAWYDRENNQLRPFFNPSLQDGWYSDNRVASSFLDKQGNIWMCSTMNGLEKVTFNINNFHLHSIKSGDLEYSGNNIRAIYQDNNGHIWVGSKDKIIRVYDKDLNYLGNLTFRGNILPGSADELGMAYCFYQDHTGTLWIGTKGKGLIAASQDSPLKYTLKHHTFSDNDQYSISSNEVYSIHEDQQQRLWIATYEGGINYLDLNENKKNPQFVSHRNRLKKYPIEQYYRTRFITSDRRGQIWVGSAAGLLICNSPNNAPEEMNFKDFSRIPGDEHSLSNNDVHNIFFTQNEETYITTFGGGFCKLIEMENDRAKFQSYTTKDGLPSDILLSVEEDSKGNLWFSTEEGLIKFDPVGNKITSYQSRVLPHNINFSEGAALRTQDERLMFATRIGVLTFAPDSIKNSDFVPSLIFTDFQQSEKRTGTEVAPVLTTNIDDTRSVELPHDQNGFNIKFAALDLKNPNSILYAYLLEGFDDKWNYIGKQRSATYTNLPKGEYILKVRSTNSDGIWMDNTRSLHITILPSFWETPWAYMLYLLLGILIVFVAAYILFVIFRLKHKVTIEQQVSDLKLRFFTNVSHDLRTPLTLIIGPVEQVLQNGKLRAEDKEQLILVRKNTNRMLHLVNQILDFRKIQNKKMKMRVQQIDLTNFVRNVMESFNYLADQHQIDFGFETHADVSKIWADADKLEKILFNLLSNAFKYTPQGKQIKVVIRSVEKEIQISVKDQGIGISEDKQKSLFVRFENLMDKNVFNQASTGIGLSLVKELVDMHHGTIDVYSRQGEGSCFTVCLPKGKEHFGVDTEFILTDYEVTQSNQTYSDLSLSFNSISQTIDQEKETLLIVEDNPELRFFLKSVFAQYFNIIEAENGNEGFDKSKEFLPDIIISDVMMPQKDGIDMTNQLRKEIATSHIPIVLLTAKSTIESKIKGMEFGADDYITKPFSVTYLRARIFNLLEQRKKLQAIYCASLQPHSVRQDGSKRDQSITCPSLPLSPNDQRFMEQVMTFIEDNIDNGDLRIEDISTDANMSRSVFFKKMKTLTGLSPVEFLRDIRMKRAAQLIETNDYNVSQVSYMVGINDPHYFSKCFKQQYGLTPTEYRERSLE